MALIKCPECGKKVSDKANECIHCGYPINNNDVNDDIAYIDKIMSEMKLKNHKIKTTNDKPIWGYFWV